MPKHHVDRNRWVKASNGQAPPGTLVGGHDVNGEPIYVARALHNGDLIPGKLVASQKCAYVSWGGLEFKKHEYEVLVGNSNNWIATENSNIPPGAFLGGQTARGDLFYMGRALLRPEKLTMCKVFVTYLSAARKSVSTNTKSLCTTIESVWVKASCGDAPSGSLVGGHDSNGEPIYVARAECKENIIPGKLLATQRCTFVTWKGEEYKRFEYEVLVGSTNIWVEASGAKIPIRTYTGGYTKTGEVFYIARVHHQGTITTGNVQLSKGLCYIAFDGKELSFPNYEVLTY